VTTDPAAARRPDPVLHLRPLRPGDEAPFRAGHEAIAADGFTFGTGLESGMPWLRYLEILAEQQRGAGLPPSWVPGTFLVADVAGEIVGRSSVRHGLTDFLEREGGHIGYGVLPEYRRRGYATEILRQSLIVARAIGIDRVLVTCDDSNIGSIAVIEACGGRLDNIIASAASGSQIRRYWFD